MQSHGNVSVVIHQRVGGDVSDHPKLDRREKLFPFSARVDLTERDGTLRVGGTRSNNLMISKRLRQRQTVRFVRSDILFYDEHIIDLYQQICALYRMR